MGAGAVHIVPERPQLGAVLTKPNGGGGTWAGGGTWPAQPSLRSSEIEGEIESLELGSIEGPAAASAPEAKAAASAGGRR